MLGMALYAIRTVRTGIDFVTPYEMFVLEVPLTQIYLRQPAFDLGRRSGCAVSVAECPLLGPLATADSATPLISRAGFIKPTGLRQGVTSQPEHCRIVEPDCAPVTDGCYDYL